MIILGNPIFSAEQFHTVSTIDDVATTPNNSTVLLQKIDLQLQKYCATHNVSYGVKANTITDAIYANALKAKYIICEKDNAQALQKLAEDYMFDAKIVVSITSQDEIEWVARNAIDGVVYL